MMGAIRFNPRRQQVYFPGSGVHWNQGCIDQTDNMKLYIKSIGLAIISRKLNFHIRYFV